MWALIKALILNWAFIKTLIKSLGSLGLLVPIAFLLKFIGLPLLMVLGILALPVLIVLMFLGLPFLLVFVIGGFLLSMVGTVLTLGFTVLKIALPIIAIVWVIKWIWGWGKNGNCGPVTPPPTEPKSE
jgi:hypothetical protein